MKYDIIYADCPWKYNSRANHKTRFRGGADGHYDLMGIADLLQLPVNSISSDNSALFMWATFPMLKEAIEVMEAWGFRYVTQAFTWIKLNPKNKKPFFGVGYYTKSNAEVCLLGIKGKMKPVINTVSSVVIEPRGEHSVKPDCVRDKICDLYGPQNRLEMFGRSSDDRFNVIGNGMNGKDIREELAEMSDKINGQMELMECVG
jgi:site-specific DNA-methyltransferase (adenine-specific)